MKDLVEVEINDFEGIADNQKALSPGKLIVKRFFRSKLSVIGLVILLGLIAFSFLGPLLSVTSLPIYGETDTSEGQGQNIIVQEVTVKENGETYTYYFVTTSEKNVERLAKPSALHWFGTDEQGRDVFSRLMYGGRISLTIGLIVVILETIVGVLLGGIAGYYGKWVDQLIMRIVDIFNCIPTLPFLLIASAIIEAAEIDPRYRIYYLMVILTIFGWAGTARMVRGQILTLREQEFMISAEAMGYGSFRKIMKHLVPNVMPQLIVSMTLGLGGIILMEATLSYLGLGVTKPYAAWGTMIGALKDFNILKHHIYLWAPPGLCIMLAVLAFNFVGDGLRDAFDPKMKR